MPKQGQVNENLSLQWAVSRDHLIHSEAQFNTWGENFNEDNIYSVSWVRNQPNHFWSINPLNSYDNPIHHRCDSSLLYICEDWDTVSKFIIRNHMNRKWLSLDVPIHLNVGPFLPSITNIELIFEWTSDLTSSLEKPSYWKALSFQVVSNLHSFTSSLKSPVFPGCHWLT